jgi:hypothetical protein
VANECSISNVGTDQGKQAATVISIATNGHNLSVNDNKFMDTSTTKANISETQTVLPDGHVVNNLSIAVPSGPQILSSVLPLKSLTICEDIEMTSPEPMNEDMKPMDSQIPQPSVHNSLALVSGQRAQRALVCHPGNHDSNGLQTLTKPNNMKMLQTNNSTDNSLDDIIYNYVNKINLGLITNTGNNNVLFNKLKVRHLYMTMAQILI